LAAIIYLVVRIEHLLVFNHNLSQ